MIILVLGLSVAFIAMSCWAGELHSTVKGQRRQIDDLRDVAGDALVSARCAQARAEASVRQWGNTIAQWRRLRLSGDDAFIDHFERLLTDETPIAGRAAGASDGA